MLSIYGQTPAWEVILRRYLAGAVLAGCSAGAMAFGGWTPSLGGLRAGRLVTLSKALGVVPGLIVLPHFDKMGRFVPAGTFNSIAKGAPESAVLVGIDEDTALLKLPGVNQWQVSGRQTVSVFDPSLPGGKKVYRAGETVSLPS